MTDYLFVYGTLMSGSQSAQAKAVARSAMFVGPALLQGKLFLVDQYPACVPSADPDNQVLGDIYQLAQSELLSMLDDYEECSAKFPEPTEYRRVKHHVRLLSGDALEAWVYIYNRSTVGLNPLKKGRFVVSGYAQDVTRK